MKFLVLLLFLALSISLEGQAIDPGTELTLDAGWRTTVPLAVGQGRFRLEAATLSGDPFGVVVEKRNSDGTWSAVTMNKNLQGVLQSGVEFAAGLGEAWRVRPLAAMTVTVVLKLSKVAFAELRETLKQELTLPPAASLMRLRSEFPVGTGGARLSAFVQKGSLWVGWLADGGWSAEVWDAAQGKRLGKPLSAPAPWNGLSLNEGPSVTLSSAGGLEGRLWTGGDWVVEAGAPDELINRWGRFRAVATAEVKVFRAGNTGWVDLSLPRNTGLDKVLLAATDDGLAVFLASSKDSQRAFYTWTPDQGWVAHPAPPATGPPVDGLWAATGSGVLVHVEAEAEGLVLRRFDGASWLPPLDLGFPDAKAVALLPPSAWSKTGTLVVATDSVRVYDLP